MGYNHYRFARKLASGSVSIVDLDATELIRIYKSGFDTTLFGGETTSTSALYLKANRTDSTPNISMVGARQLQLNGASNYDIILNSSGTGRLKYGTYNATGDVACNGYIEIKIIIYLPFIIIVSSSPYLF